MSDLYDYFDKSPLPYKQDEKRMVIILPGEAWNEEEECYEDIEIPAKFTVCENCDGRGSHSKHLGSYTREEFDETFWDEEDRDAYFRGMYDMVCEECKGKRVVLVPSDNCTPEELQAFEEVLLEAWKYREEQLAEIRMGA